MKHIGICGYSILSCLFSLACTPASHPIHLANAPVATRSATAPARQTVRVDCQVLEEGKTVSRPSLLVENGKKASFEIGHGTLTILGHEIPDGIQLHLTPTLTGNVITINGEMIVSRRDDAASTGGSDATWILQRAHRWVFEVRCDDPDRWFASPRSVEGYSLRLRARLDTR